MPMLSLRLAIAQAVGTNPSASYFGLWIEERVGATLLQSPASTFVSRQADSESELEGVAVAGITQRPLMGRTKKLIAQPEPAAQLWRRLCCRPRPTLACEIGIELRKLAVLSQGQQCD